HALWAAAHVRGRTAAHSSVAGSTRTPSAAKRPGRTKGRNAGPYASATKAGTFEGPPNVGGPTEPSALTRKPGVSSGTPTRKPGTSRAGTKLNMLQSSSSSGAAGLFMGDRSKATHY